MLSFFMATNYVAGPAQHSMCLNILSVIIILESTIINIPHFRNEEMEAQTVYVTYTGSHGKQAAEGKLKMAR